MPFLISILIHGLVGIGVLVTSNVEKQEGNTPGNKKGQHSNQEGLGGIQHRDIIEIELKPVEPPKLVDTKEKDPNGLKDVMVENKDCPNWFGGIGIIHNLDQRIEKVVRGYPAYKSGCVKVGDYLFDVQSDNGEVTGDVDKTIVLTLIRDGIRVNCTLVRSKICTKDIP